MKIVKKAALVIAAGAALLAASVPAHAAHNVARIDVPFAFLAGDQQFPAGSYWVRLDRDFHLLDLKLATSNKVIRVRVHDGKATRKATSAERATLSFLKYGSECVLRAVFLSGDTQSYELKMSSREMELAKAIGAPVEVEGSTELR
jgi:hypothetical protein